MNWDEIAGSWNQVKGKIQEQWGRLTSDDLSRAEGKRDQLLGLLQERYGWVRDEAERKLDDFVKRL